MIHQDRLWNHNLERNVERNPSKTMFVLLFLQAKGKKEADEIDKHIDAPLHMEVALFTDRWCVIYLNCCAQFNLKCCFAQGGLGTATKRSRFFEFKICKWNMLGDSG